jgi:pimeloyl-ACP methyl ester carboxylesterase
MTAAVPLLLPGFEYRRVGVDGLTVNCAVRGAGPPLLLLHGYPETHLMWRLPEPECRRTRRGSYTVLWGR